MHEKCGIDLPISMQCIMTNSHICVSGLVTVEVIINNLSFTLNDIITTLVLTVHAILQYCKINQKELCH